MTRACKHRDVRQGFAWDPVGQHNVISLHCGTCGSWLSLGPSSETDPRVALEIRALEILDAVRHQRHGLIANDEHYGWNLHQLGYDIDADVPAIWAGWLAREIWVHGDEHGGER